MPGPKLSNPYGELAINNAKYIKDCTELYLANQGIEKLADFEKFTNLEVLWLNGNKLERVEDLDDNIRLRKLYIQNNKVHTLKGSFGGKTATGEELPSKFKFLEALHASNNLIHGLHATLDILSKLRLITELDLFGNPLAEETDYRLHVIRRIPSLQVFDRHVVTAEERDAAALLGTSRQTKNDPLAESKPWIPQLSGTVKMMMSEVKHLRREGAAREAAERKAMFQLAGDEHEDVLGDPPPAYKSRKVPSESELDQWQQYNLRQIFNTFDLDKSGTLSREELKRCVKEMEDCGRSIDLAINDLDSLFDVLDTNNDDKISWKEFLKASTEGVWETSADDQPPVQKMPPLKWDTISWQDAKERSEDLYEEAADIQMKSLAMDSTDPRKSEMERQAKDLSNKANRLNALYTQLTAKIKAPAKQPPKPRSDLVNMYDYKQRDNNESDSSDEEEEVVDKTTIARRKKFGLTDSSYKQFRKDRRGARPQRSVKGQMNM
jgi:hypothetical protein